ncbi:MAG: hypothetical protein LBE84_11130 [Planctomycetota bacterium]|nr:hypothetical protein [Planctomycetota bacterium]
MSAATRESLTPELIFAEPDSVASGKLELLQVDVMAANWEAATIIPENLSAFFELVYGADIEYLGAEPYLSSGADAAESCLEWEIVCQALSESRGILIAFQNLLADVLDALGVEDARFLRVQADSAGNLRLVSEHPRREEIETVLNSPENNRLREMYAAALAGMSLAGGLVGGISVPPGVLDRMRIGAGTAA